MPNVYAAVRTVEEGVCRVFKLHNWTNPLPPSTCTTALVDGERELLRRTAHFDQFARRTTKRPKSQTKPDKFIAVYGCSFMYGVGVSDDETFPAQLAKRMPNVHIYNYGVGGWGPNNFYRRAEKYTFAPNELEEKEGIILYVAIEDHLRRVVSPLSHKWNEYGPYYTLDEGKLVFHGSFVFGRPWTQRLYNAIRWSGLHKRLGFNIPPRVTRSNIELASALLSEGAKILVSQVQGARVVVLLFPDGNLATQAMMKEWSLLLQNQGVEVLDLLKERLNVKKGEWMLPDRHPSSKVYEQLAERAVPHLRKLLETPRK
jgi:hypothetical protein